MAPARQSRLTPGGSAPRSWTFRDRAAIEAVAPPRDPAAGSVRALVDRRADEGRFGDPASR